MTSEQTDTITLDPALQQALSQFLAVLLQGNMTLPEGLGIAATYLTHLVLLAIVFINPSTTLSGDAQTALTSVILTMLTITTKFVLDHVKARVAQTTVAAVQLQRLIQPPLSPVPVGKVARRSTREV